jgi:transcriptional regulator with XRE-family HTH domain
VNSAPLRQLSDEIIKIRKRLGLTLDDVAEGLGWSRGRVGNWENRKWSRPDAGNVERLLDFYGVKGAEKEALLGLVKQARKKDEDWWRAYGDVISALPAFEDAASLIRIHESVLIPGLFQTEEYARALLLSGQVLDPAVVDRKIEVRSARQRILERENPPQIWAILDEAALTRLVGGADVMAAQIRHLIELAVWPHITIQVLPFTAGAHAGLTGGRFMILDFPGDDRPLVYLEEASSSLFLETADDVQGYTITFSRITSSALGPEESVAYLATLRDRLTR